MPKFLVTSGSYFQPFTYDELAKPVMQAVEAHNAAQDQYDTLTTESEALRQYLLREPENSEARKMYDAYMTKLSDLQNNLWSRGYNAGTRRDLSAARAGYASDITRLGTAIKARQDRSNEYWKIKHEHPDMVMSADPGTASLDEYLHDDRFGQNYYTYSGEAFMNEVGADAKARAKEIISDPKVLERYPELAGYIPVLKTQGFSSVQVEAAAALVKGDTSLYDSIPDLGSKTAALILSNILQSHLDSTGASGRVSPEEYDRLIQYGKAGLGQAVGGGDVDFMEDKKYAFDQQARLIQMRTNAEVAAHRRKKEIDAEFAAREAPQLPGYTNTGETINMESPRYREWVAATKQEAKAYENGQTKTVIDPGNQTARTIRNEYEMASLLYETPDRTEIRRKYGGFDIALSPGNGKERQSFTVTLKDGSKHTLEAYALTPAEAKARGLDPATAIALKEDGHINEHFTKEFSDARRRYFNHVQRYKDANPGIEKDAIDPQKQKKLREDYGFSRTASWNDFYPYMTTKEKTGDFSAVVIANDSSHDYEKENLARAIIRQYNSNPPGDDKTSRFAFYEVNPGNTGHSLEGITDIKQIFGTKNGGTELRDDTLTNISATLEDLAAERPMVRIQTSVNPGKTYLIDAAMLGPLFENNFTTPLRGTGRSNSQMIDYLLFPILHPDDVYKIDRRTAVEWSRNSAELLGGDFPAVIGANGEPRPATPIEILRHKDFQEILRDSVMERVANPTAAKLRQAIGQNHEQHFGDQSAQAGPIL